MPVRFETGLRMAADTGLHFYDAELLRLRGRTRADAAARLADVTAALNLAAKQGATLVELRAALDVFELRGAQAREALVDVIGRVPAGTALPELARAGELVGDSR